MASGVKLTMGILKHRLLNINPDIEIISEVYKNTKTPLNVRCKVCNYEWVAKPCYLLRGHGCIKCYRKRNMIANCDFLKLVSKDIIIMNEYNGYRSTIHCKCIDLLEINYNDDIEEKLNIYFKTKSRND